jgi:flagellar assembly factor FliW
MIAISSYGAQVEDGNAMQVETLVKGTVEVRPEQIITFASPLIGFPALRRFVLLSTDKGPLYWLQAIDERDAAFCVLAPFQAGLDPDFTIQPEDLAELDAAAPDQIDVYTMLVLDRDPGRIRTNLRAPILVARKSNRAKQVVLDDPRLPIQFFLRDLPRLLKPRPR